MRARRPSTLLVASLLALLLVAPATGSSAQSLEEVRSERAAIQRRLDAATERLGDVQERVAELEAERAALAAEADALASEVAAIREGMQDQLVALFKRGSVRDPLTVFLTSDEPQEALLRAQTVERVVVGELAEVEALGADRRRLVAVRERLDEREQQVEAAVAEQRELLASLEADLDRAAELERRLEAEERERREAEERRRREAEQRRQREAAAARGPAETEADDDDGGDDAGSSGGGASAPVSSGGMACPVAQPRSFSDTWGAPRSGGRSHRGTDILAPYGTPVHAIVSGTWSIQSPGPSAGLWAILRGDDGNHYWYLHLQSHTVGNGARVQVGQQVATNGDTGNARGTPHVHFELHPGGGSAINPYPTLASIC